MNADTNQQETPLISIIIPVYNVEKYIRECLDSVFVQTLPSIEVICVDDGSTDRSPDILNEYARKDARLKIVSQKNKGPGAARNTGIQLAQAKYIYFMDSDDTIDPDLCRLTYIAAEYFRCDILYFDYVAYDERAPLQAAALLALPRYFGIKTPARNNKTFNPWLRLTRTDFLKQHQLLFPEAFLTHEDMIFDWQCFLAEPNIGIFPAKLYFYRHRQVSLVHSSGQRKNNSIEGNKELKKRLVAAGRYEEFKELCVAQKLHDIYLHGYCSCRWNTRKAFKRQIIESMSDDDWAYVPQLNGVFLHFYESLRGNPAAKVRFWLDWNIRRLRSWLSYIGVGVWRTRFLAIFAKRYVAKWIKQNREICEALANLMEENIARRNDNEQEAENTAK